VLNDLSGVGELGKQILGDKGAYLDLGESGICESINPSAFLVCGNDGCDGLQTITGPHLADSYCHDAN
jgi:hypothetical protein